MIGRDLETQTLPENRNPGDSVGRLKGAKRHLSTSKASCAWCLTVAPDVHELLKRVRQLGKIALVFLSFLLMAGPYARSRFG
jgi:hypothetical protein